jgi:hypothetical protein
MEKRITIKLNLLCKNMDILNDRITNGANPINSDLSDSEISENQEYASKLQNLNNNRRKRKGYTFDDWCIVYSDDLWYLWGIISEYRNTHILNNLDFPGFCDMCYQNSTKT